MAIASRLLCSFTAALSFGDIGLMEALYALGDFLVRLCGLIQGESSDPFWSLLVLLTDDPRLGVPDVPVRFNWSQGYAEKPCTNYFYRTCLLRLIFVGLLFRNSSSLVKERDLARGVYLSCFVDDLRDRGVWF